MAAAGGVREERSARRRAVSVILRFRPLTDNCHAAPLRRGMKEAH